MLTVTDILLDSLDGRCGGSDIFLCLIVLRILFQSYKYSYLYFTLIPSFSTFNDTSIFLKIKRHVRLLSLGRLGSI